MQNTDLLPRKSPEGLGVSSRSILDFIDAVHEHKLELHSFMLLRHGSVAAEGWWAPYGPNLRHMLYSLTKSFASTGIGLAIKEGRLSVDDRVISFFPDDLPAEISENLEAMRVRHLLSMSTGHEEDTTGRMVSSHGPDWVRAFLALPVEREPGTHFVYNSGASYMLSAIISKVTEQRLADYLTPRLFEPLGIENPSWELSPEGLTIGGWGLSIRTEDIAKLGQLYLNRGAWRGQRVLTEEWVSEATSKQVSNGDGGDNDWAQGYGYQFWRCRHGAFRGDGMFGQFCIVMPEKDAVVAITSGVSDMGGVLNLVWEHVLPALGSEPLPEDDAREALAQKMSSLAIPPPVDKASSPAAPQVSGRRISVTGPDGGEWDCTLAFHDDRCSVGIDDSRGHYAFDCGLGRWLVSETELPGKPLGGSGASRIAVSGGWADNDIFQMTIRFIETPHLQTIICHLGGDEPRLELQPLQP